VSSPQIDVTGGSEFADPDGFVTLGLEKRPGYMTVFARELL